MSKFNYWKLFKLSFLWGLVALLLTVVTVLIVTGLGDEKLCGKLSCFNYFFTDVMKVPTLLLTLLVPVWGILLLLHRSQQTERQLSATESQLNTSRQQLGISEAQHISNNYFIHRREFDVICKNIEEQFSVVVNNFEIYKLMFPKNSFQVLQLSQTDSANSVLSQIFPAPLFERWNRGELSQYPIQADRFAAEVNTYYRLRCLEYLLTKLGLEEKQLGYKIAHPNISASGVPVVNVQKKYDYITFPCGNVRDSALLLIRFLPALCNYADIPFDAVKLKDFFKKELRGITDEYVQTEQLFELMEEKNLHGALSQNDLPGGFDERAALMFGNSKAILEQSPEENKG